MASFHPTIRAMTSGVQYSNGLVPNPCAPGDCKMRDPGNEVAWYPVRINQKYSAILRQNNSTCILCFVSKTKAFWCENNIILKLYHCRTSLRYLLVLQTYNLQRRILGSRRFQARIPRAHFTHGTVSYSHPKTHSIPGALRCIILQLRSIKPQVNTR